MRSAREITSLRWYHVSRDMPCSRRLWLSSRRGVGLRKMLSSLVGRNGLHHRSVMDWAFSNCVLRSFISQISPVLPSSPPCPHIRYHLHHTHFHILGRHPSPVSKNSNL